MQRGKHIAVLGTFKTTLAATVLGLLAFVLIQRFDLDPFERFAAFLSGFDHYEADELFLLLLLIAAALLVDVLLLSHRRKQEAFLRQQRLRVLKATMRTVQDIVNNFLNGLQLFHMEAEEDGGLSKESLALMESLIFETSEKLSQLADLSNIPFKQMASGVDGIDYQAEASVESERPQTDAAQH